MCGICGKEIPRGFGCNCRAPFTLDELELLADGLRSIAADYYSDRDQTFGTLRRKVYHMLSYARNYALAAGKP